MTPVLHDHLHQKVSNILQKEIDKSLNEIVDIMGDAWWERFQEEILDDEDTKPPTPKEIADAILLEYEKWNQPYYNYSYMRHRESGEIYAAAFDRQSQVKSYVGPISYRHVTYDRLPNFDYFHSDDMEWLKQESFDIVYPEDFQEIKNNELDKDTLNQEENNMEPVTPTFFEKVDQDLQQKISQDNLQLSLLRLIFNDPEIKAIVKDNQEMLVKSLNELSIELFEKWERTERKWA